MGSVTANTGSFRLGPDAGRVVIKTSRAGLAAKAGHDLTIEFTRWSAQVELPGEDAGGVTAASISAQLDLGSLEVRTGTGGAKPLTDSASFTSSRIVRFGASGGAVEGALTLNGQTQPIRLQLNAPGEGRYRGSGTVIQTAFGIKPYSGFFGALKLKDEVTVEFEADLSRTGTAAPA